MRIARSLVSGVDVWLNTPRRPLEACGIGGMKAGINGALNLSTLDGWWDEVWNDADPDEALTRRRPLPPATRVGLTS